MDTNYFSKVRILDGGMGQELLARGLKAKGTLWSATALLDKKYHKLVIDTHLDFIEAGADVIITNNFSARRLILVENKSYKYFNYINEKAGELALNAKKISKKNILIGGSLPAQNSTYRVDERDVNLIEKDFFDQAKLIKPFIDFFYLDVVSSGKEISIALNVTEKLNLPVLIGVHIGKNGKLPSNESISDIIKKYKTNNWLGLITACVSPEIVENTVDEIKQCNIHFGFKVNLWEKDPIPAQSIQNKYKTYSGTPNEAINPNEVLGKRSEYTEEIFFEFAKKIMDKGATILGGCCETNPSHINKISSLKN